MAAQVREVELQSLREEAARAQRMLDWRQERRNQRDLAEAQVTCNVFIRACGLSCMSFKTHVCREGRLWRFIDSLAGLFCCGV